MKRPLILFILFAGLCQCQQTGQRPDDSFDPAVKNPAYDAESGPLVYLDEGHANFHTAAGRYRPFVKILARDGYRVEPFGRDDHSRSACSLPYLRQLRAHLPG